MKSKPTDNRRVQALKLRERLFAGVEPFRTEKAGFVPLPVVLRKAQFLFSARGWQIYSYVLMRGGTTGLAWFPLKEMAWDLNFRSLPKLKPYVDELVDQGWLCRSSSRGRDYYLPPNPATVLQKMRDENKIPLERAEAIDELLEALKRRSRQEPASGREEGTNSETLEAIDDDGP